MQSAGPALEDLLVSAKNQDYLRVQSAGTALEELLVSAKNQDYLTVGVYESAKIMNV